MIKVCKGIIKILTHLKFYGQIKTTGKVTLYKKLKLLYENVISLLLSAKRKIIYWFSI